jgi:hypothetical protein
MTTNKSEGDLEARMRVAIEAAFPWLKNDLEHQVSFSVKLGHTTVRVDGRKAEQLTGRADILISSKGRSIAVLELKREGVALAPADVQQGLSYARLMTPIAPLVVVSNGKDLWIYETYSGEAWVPKDSTEQAFHNRLLQINKLSTKGVGDAISTLMDADHTHWVTAFNAISTQQIDERSGGRGEMGAPFMRGILWPRRATSSTIAAINEKKRAVVIHGPPLSGKSNILRELCEKSNNCDNTAVLLVEPDELGIFETIAGVLANLLKWHISPADAREWIRQVSKSHAARLVIALDGVDPRHSKVLAELNELVGTAYGNALNIVLSVDDSALDAIAKKRNGRENTALGRIMVDIPVSAMDDDEFKEALNILAKHRIHMTPGGPSVLSLREPWVLRSLMPSGIVDIPAEMAGTVSRLPPMLDYESLQRAAAACVVDTETETSLTLAAEAILEDYMDSKNVADVLQGITTFAVSHRRLESEIGVLAIDNLRQRGFIKAGINWSGQAVWFVRVPALIAKYIEKALSKRLIQWTEPDDAARKLIRLSSRIPLGELIACGAIIALITGQYVGDRVALLRALFEAAPHTTVMHPGTKFAFSLGGQVAHAELASDYKLQVSIASSKFEIELDEASLNNVSDLGGWLILSHVAGVSLGFHFPDGTIERIDGPLLLQIAQSPLILSRPDGQQDFKEVAVHDLKEGGSVVCHLAGVVEPVTWGLLKFFLRGDEHPDHWIDEAISTASPALLMRTHIALTQVSRSVGDRGEWARSVLDGRIGEATSLYLH